MKKIYFNRALVAKKKLLFFALMATLGLFFTACEPKQPEEPAITLQGIKLNQTSVTLYEKEEVKLRVRYTPEEAAATAPAVVWYSDKQRVASVDDNGRVKADRVGTAVITAQCGQFEAKCTVDVLKNDLPEPDPKVVFSVEPKKIDAPAEGGSFLIEVKSNVAWTAEMENSEWAALSATSGDGDATLTLTVAGSEDPEVASQDITFKAGKGSYYVRVTRAGFVKINKFSIDKTSSEIIPVSGGSATVNVESDLEWTVTCNDPHVSIAKSANSVTFNVQKFNIPLSKCQEYFGNNAATIEDLGIFFYIAAGGSYPIPVIFSNGEKDIKFSLRQELPYIKTKVISGSEPHPSGGYFNVLHTKDYNAHSFTVQVESNIPWEIKIYYNGSASCGDTNWASASPYSGTGNGTVTISFEDNSTSDCEHREGELKFYSAGGYVEFTKTYDTWQAGPSWKPLY
ncbi:MAG: Ig-like domain-containing protein [Paludibacteraceae bacterium]|nr:Ig-like domain-containing protein [Paludibacteraceae bacterium]